MKKDAKKINDEQMKNGQKMEETEKIINKNVQTTNEELYKTVHEKVEEKTELSKKIDDIDNRLTKIDDEIMQMKTQNSRFNKAILKINELFESFSEIEIKYDGFEILLINIQIKLIQ